MRGPMVERLRRSAKGELVEVFGEAFAEHPMVPALGGRADDARPVMKVLVDYYWRMKSLQLWGIRADDGLACAALCVEPREDPSLVAVARLLWGVTRVAGRQAMGGLLDVERHKPVGRGRELELAILGTAPAHQRRGLGRNLLQSLFSEAVMEEYQAILLLTDRDTPAFDLYRSEGFDVEREFRTNQQALCWMRRVL